MKLKTKLTSVAIFMVIFLGGCNLFSFAYKSKVMQGNFLEKDYVDQLQVGMTKEQVSFLMGNSILDDPYKKNRWDYIFLLDHGNGRTQRRVITLYFNEEKLSKITGDIKFTDDNVETGKDFEAK